MFAVFVTLQIASVRRGVITLITFGGGSRTTVRDRVAFCRAAQVVVVTHAAALALGDARARQDDPFFRRHPTAPGCTP